MFSERIERAVQVALSAHAGQTRKGDGNLPYVSHPLHAGFMLAKLGADDDTIAAAILHDVVEDCDDWTLDDIRREFGEHVAAIVDDLSEDKDLHWNERKQWAVDHVQHMSPEGIMVKAADKLHNLTSLANQLEHAENHDEVWSKFTGGRERTLVMSRALVDALSAKVDERLGQALGEVMERLERG